MRIARLNNDDEVHFWAEGIGRVVRCNVLRLSNHKDD